MDGILPSATTNATPRVQSKQPVQTSTRYTVQYKYGKNFKGHVDGFHAIYADVMYSREKRLCRKTTRKRRWLGIVLYALHALRVSPCTDMFWKSQTTW